MIAPAPTGSRAFLAQFKGPGRSAVSGLFMQAIRKGARTPGGVLRFVSQEAPTVIQPAALLDFRTALLTPEAVEYAREVLRLAGLPKAERERQRQERRDRHPARVAALSRGHCNNSYF